MYLVPYFTSLLQLLLIARCAYAKTDRNLKQQDSKCDLKSGNCEDGTSTTEAVEKREEKVDENPFTEEAQLTLVSPKPDRYLIWGRGTISENATSDTYALDKIKAFSTSDEFRIVSASSDGGWVGTWSVRVSATGPWAVVAGGEEVTNASALRLSWSMDVGFARLRIDRLRGGERVRSFLLLKTIFPPTPRLSGPFLEASVGAGRVDSERLRDWTRVGDLVSVARGPKLLAAFKAATVPGELIVAGDEKVAALVGNMTLRISERVDDALFGVSVFGPSARGGTLFSRKNGEAEAAVTGGGIGLALSDELRFSASGDLNRFTFSVAPIITYTSHISLNVPPSICMYLRSKSGRLGPSVPMTLLIDLSRFTTTAVAGSTSTAAPPDCAGLPGGTAAVNRCGRCVGGRTGRKEDEGVNRCGNCEPTESCLDCDGRPYGAKRMDSCGICRNPDSDAFNSGCGSKLAWVRPRLFALGEDTNITFRISLEKGADFFDRPQCAVLSSDSSETAVESVRAQRIEGRFRVFRGFVPGLQVGGAARLRCQGVTQLLDGLAALDLATLRPVSLQPLSIKSAGPNKLVTVSFSGPIGAAVSDADSEAFCVEPTRTSVGRRFPATRSGQRDIVCDLGELRGDGAKELLPVLSPDLLDASLKLYGAVLRAHLDASLDTLLLELDRDAATPTADCADSFPADQRALLGTAPECSAQRRTLSVRLGEGHSIVPGTRLSFTNGGGAAKRVPPVALPENAPLPSFELRGPQTLRRCDAEGLIEAARLKGTGKRPLDFTWKLLDTYGPVDAAKTAALRAYLGSASGPSVRLSRAAHLSDGAEFSLAASACNFADLCSTEVRATIAVADSEAALNIQILGASDGEVVGVGRTLRLEYVLDHLNCAGVPVSGDGVSIAWRVNGVSKGTAQALKFPMASSLPGSVVEISVSAESASGLSSGSSVRLSVVGEAPELRLGPSSRTLGPGKPLLIDASDTRNPNGPASGLDFTWSCVRADGSACAFLNASVAEAEPTQLISLDELRPNIGPTLRLPAAALLPGRHTVTVTASAAGQTSSGVVSVDVAAADAVVDGAPAQPLLEALPLDVRGGKPDPAAWLSLRARLGAREDLRVAVEIRQLPGGEEVLLPQPYRERQETRVAKAFLENDDYVFAISIPPKDEGAGWSGLNPGTDYNVIITAEGALRMSEAGFGFKTNEPPAPGILKLSNDGTQLRFGDELVMEVGDGWEDADMPLSLSFGVGSVASDGGPARVQWFPESTQSRRAVFLPPAIPRMACDRVAWTAVVRVCDSLGACRRADSEPFTVLPLGAAEEAAARRRLQERLQKEQDAGEAFGPWQKAAALRAADCGGPPSAETKAASRGVASSILAAVTAESGPDELATALRQSTELLADAEPGSAAQIVAELKRVTMLLIRRPVSGRRRKRATADDVIYDPQLAATVLGSLDTILQLGGGGDVDYLALKGNMLGSFCRQLDSSRPPIEALSGAAKPLARIHSQVKTVTEAFTDANLAANIVDTSLISALGTSGDLRSRYAMWACGGGTCASVCLASTAFPAAAYAQAPLDLLLFKGEKELNTSLLASELVLAEWRDPVDGAALANMHASAALATLRLPLLNKTMDKVLQCYIRKSGGAWARCGDGETSVDGATYSCACVAPGVAGAFIQDGPPLPNLRPFDAIRIGLRLTDGAAGLDGSTLLAQLAAAAGVTAARLVEPTALKADGSLELLLRPSFAGSAALDVAEAVRALNRSLAVGLWLNGRTLKVDPHSLTAAPVRRRMVLDPQGRLVKFSASAPGLVGLKMEDQPAELPAWVERLAAALHFPAALVSIQDLEANGSEVGVTVKLAKVPDTVSALLSPEEAALLLEERIRYAELRLAMADGTPVNIRRDSADIQVLLRVNAAESDLLPIIMGSAVGGVFLLVVVVVIVLVLVKQKGREDKIGTSPSSSPDPHSPPQSAATSTITVIRRLSIDRSYR